MKAFPTKHHLLVFLFTFGREKNRSTISMLTIVNQGPKSMRRRLEGVPGHFKRLHCL